MGQYAVRTAVEYDFVEEVVVADLDADAASRFTRGCGPKSKGVGLDVEDAFRAVSHDNRLLLTIAEQIVGDNGFATVAVEQCMAAAVPDDIVVDHHRQIGRFQEYPAEVRRVCSDDDVLRNPTVGVAVIDP